MIKDICAKRRAADERVQVAYNQLVTISACRALNHPQEHAAWTKPTPLRNMLPRHQIPATRTKPEQAPGLCWFQSERRFLEGKLSGKLDTAWPAASKERVARANISRCGNWEVTAGIGAIKPCIRDPGGQKWVGKIGMVEQVEDFRAQLHVQAFSQLCILEDREIKLFVRGST